MKEVKWKGYDISYCQPKVNWDKVKADFVIIKAGEGLTIKDGYFEQHYKNAKAKNIPVGAYWFSHALDINTARKEARKFAETIKGKQFEMPLFLDIEAKEQQTLTKQQLSDIIRTFLEELEGLGYWVGLYHCYADAIARVDESIRRRYTFWLAWWLGPDGNTKKYNYPIGMWQYGVEKNKEAFNGDVDADYCYYDYPTEIKKKGLNGFGPSPTPVPPPQFEPIKKGDHGDRVKEMQSLLVKKGYLRANEVDGSFGKITLSGLLGFQFENGLKTDGICDEDDWIKLNS